MNVRKEDSPADPAYPDAKEFLKNRAALGAAILGAGMALGSCNSGTRLDGIPSAPSMDGAGVMDRNRLDGVAVSEPKTDPPRLPGKAKIEPPPVPGSPPVTPPNPEY